MKGRLLKLSPGYYVLWFVLLLVFGSKIFLLRGLASGHFLEIGLFGLAMLVVSYVGGWLVWLFSGKDQRAGELSYLAIMTVLFLVRTVLLYREGLAAG